MRPVSALVIALALVAVTPGQTQPADRTPRQVHGLFFLAVGNSEYRRLPAELSPDQRRQAGLIQLRRVDGLNRSARRMAQRLRAMGARGGIRLVSEADAHVSVRDIWEALDAVLAMAASADRPFLVVYVAAHGLSEGVAWTHFSIPGDFIGPVDWSDGEGMARRALATSDLVTRLEAAAVPFLVLLDSCQEGEEHVWGTEVLAPAAAQSLNAVGEALRFLNRFSDSHPVVFSTEPGTVVQTARDPLDPGASLSIGPLARRFLLATQPLVEAGRDMALEELVQDLLRPSLDTETRPGVCHAAVGADGPLLARGGAPPGPAWEERTGSGRFRAVAVELLTVVEPTQQEIERPAGPGSYLEYHSPPGDWVGAGESRRLESGEEPWTTRAIEQSEIYVESSTGEGFELHLVAPAGRQLAHGRYQRARRPGFQGSNRSGLSLSIGGSGCNEIRGHFEVGHLEWDSGGGVRRLEATFVQRCDRGPPLEGKLLIVADEQPLR